MTTEQLKALELTDDQIKGVMKLKGEAITAALKPVEDERDGFKAQLGEANNKIQSFAGVDLEKLNKEIGDWKQKAEAAEATASKTAYLRKVERYVDALGVKSVLARDALVAKLVDKNLQTEGDTLLGADDLVKTLKEQDPIAFLTDQQQQKGGAGFGDKTPPGQTKTGNDFMNSLIRGEVSQEGV